MKNLALTFLIILALLNSSQVSAGNLEETTMLTVKHLASSEKKAVVRIDNLIEGQKAWLKIKDQDGRILHSESIKIAPTYVRVFDFSKMTGNSYTVEVKDQERTIRKSLKIQPKVAQSTYFKPVLKTGKDLIKIIFQNPLEVPVQVRLYNQYNRLVYQTKIDPQEVYAQGLEVSMMRGKNFSLSLIAKDYYYSEDIRVK